MTTRDQVEWLRALALADLLVVALAALHSLNRRVKTYSGVEPCPGAEFSRRVIRRRIARVYGLKDRLLDALVRTGRATVRVYPRYYKTVFRCPDCGRRLPPNREAVCWGCGDGCDDGPTAVAVDELARGNWYVVSVTETTYCWHVPDRSATAAIKAVAVPVDADHDPTQPEREVPPVGVRIRGRAVRLTVAAQHAAIEAATSALLRSLEPGGTTTGAQPTRDVS